MNEKTYELRSFPSRMALADALANKTANILDAAIKKRGTAVLAVSGGSTPPLFFEALSKKQIDWENTVVTLVDERFVAQSAPRSNAALVVSRLLVNKAASARFTGLYHPVDTVEAAADAATNTLRNLPLPLDAAILGMGTDGHTASFFPDADTLTALLQADNPAIVLPVHAPSAGEPRLTLTLARLLDAGFLALHIEGEEKRTVFEKALKQDSRLPVSAVFTHSSRPVPVYWAG